MQNQGVPPKLVSRSFVVMVRMAIGVDVRAGLAGLAWFLRGKRVRGWAKMAVLAARHPENYELWVDLVEPRLIAEAMVAQAEDRRSPLIAALILSDEDCDKAKIAESAASLRAALGSGASIWSQTGGGESTIVLDDAQRASFRCAVNDIMTASCAEWFLPVLAGDRVSPALGSVLAHALREDAECKLAYWDEDRIEIDRRLAPWFKPDWDERLFLACDGVSGASVISRELISVAIQAIPDMATGPEAVVSTVLRATGSAPSQAIRHVPFVLTHRQSSSAFLTPRQRMELLERFWHEPWQVEPHAACDNCLNVRPPDPDSWPAVSILIPTRDRLELLRNCLGSLEKLDYPGRVEIIVIDNDSVEPVTLGYFKALERGGAVRVLHSPGPFNFSKLNNYGVEQATGDFLCLLNNDIEALDGKWLTEMMLHAVRPEVGAVGAKLLYPDGSLQHAGVAIGMGNAAGHVQRGVRAGDLVDFRWHGVTRRVLAVTAACLVVSRADFEMAGGLDEMAFAVAFNDVDFCLKLAKAGRSNIYVAEACLMHHESKSRGSDYDARNVERFRRELTNLQERWRTAGYADPYLNPNFSRVSDQCLLPL